MKKKFTFLIAAVMLLMMMSLPGKAVGQDRSAVAYQFTSKSWTAELGNWTSGQDGYGFTSGQGIQITTGASGANATSPVSFNSISKIEVQYCTNAKSGAGTIKVRVGSGTEKSFSVTKPSSGGTTLKTATFNYNTAESGSVKITGECTTNSIYIYSIAITYIPKVATPTFSPAAGNYASAQDVTISTGTAGATIYYTTDGTTPTTSSTPYSGSISVTESTTIRALAVKADMLDSDVATAEYSIVQNKELYVTSDHGNVTVTVNNATVELTGDHYLIPQGATVNLSVAPVGNYVHTGWIVTFGGVTITNNAFTMLANEVRITAKYSSVVVDQLTHTNVNAAMSDNSGYQLWSGVTTSNSEAVYAGHSKYSATLIQIKGESPSGIVSTTSGGYIRKIKVTWAGSNTAERYITVYGKNTPYNSASELYSDGTSGTSLGTITYNTGDESAELEITENYYYFGIKANATIYFEPLEITWQPLPAAPSFSPVGNTYYNNQLVALSCTTDGATIHYTTDGTEPNENSTTYTGAIAVNATTTIKAAAIKNGEQGPTASATYTLKCATPTFTPASGTLEIGATIALSSSTDGATLHYSTDNGDTWQDGSSVTTTATTSTVKAKATKAGYSESDVETTTYSIYQVATPTFTVAGGTYSNDQSVGINCGTEGATIRYTTNGTEPNENSTVYDGAIAVNATTTIKAKAFKNNWISSAENSATYTLKCAKPTFDPESGATLEIGATIALSSTTASAALHYSTDNGESWQDGSSVTTTATTSTVKAKATKDGYADSDEASAEYSIYQVATPTFTVAGGTYSNDQSVGINCGTEGATIRYTTDGTEPTTSSTAYSTAIPVTTTTTIKAKAFKDNWIPSAENSATYTLKCDAPAITVSGVPGSSANTYYNTASVEISAATGTTIYYTINGDDPTTGSSQYTSALTFDTPSTTTTIKAIAVKANYQNSTVASQTVTIIQPNEATFTNGEYSDLTSGFGLFYTYNVDGDDVWQWHNSNYAYLNVNDDNEDWLISPKMNSINKLAVGFTCSGQYGTSSGHHTTISVLYSVDYPGYGDPNSYTWTALSTTPEIPLSNSTFQTLSCSIDVGGNVYFAVKYDSDYCYFRIKNFTAKQFYNVTFNANGGSGSMDDFSCLVNTPTALPANTFTRDHYVFAGWATTAGGEVAYANEANITITGDTELFAKWTPARTLTYHANGGTGADIVENYVNNTVVTVADNTFTYAGHSFKEWRTSTGESYTAYAPGANFTITEDTDLYAAWDDAWVVTLNSNGICHEELVVKGQSLSLSAPAIIPSGYAYRGWTLNSASASTLVGDSYTPSGDVTLYAVYGTVTYGDFSKVTSAPVDWSGRYLLVCESSNRAFNGTVSGNWGQVASVTITSNVIKKSGTGGAPTNGVIVISKGTEEGSYHFMFYDGNYMNWTEAKKFTSGEDPVDYTISLTSGNVEISHSAYIQYNSSENKFRSYASGQTAVQLYKQTVTSDPDSYETSISAPVSSDITITTPTVITNGAVLDMGTKTLTCADPSNLIIEDGGQLVCNNSVAATVKKTIAGYRSSRGVAGWKFIASPIKDDVLPSNVTNLINETPARYDLYRLNMSGTPGKEWENYKNDDHAPFTLENGRGYLYANADGGDLTFSGDIQPSNEPKEITGLYDGYNLVGNPFTCNATLNISYYTLNATGDAILSESVGGSTPIAPCTGVIIENSSVTFTPTTDAVLSPGKGNVEMVLAQNVTTRGESTAKTLDNAIISFNEGSQLGKFYFGSQDANLYIPMDNEEYAVVSSSAQGEMPVNFKAHRDGQYTITVNPQEVEMDYLHLIDNIAGVDVDLLATPSYTFNAKADDYESRFRLVFSANMVNTDLDDDFAFFSNGQLVIANEGESLLQVIDVNGRIVTTESVSGTCSKAINVKAGVYVLRLIQGTDVKTQKIIVK